ncbi:MAG: hypothetical protein JWM11_7044 [Planctomycetaceae bacterium]|nr:hypothetical protein [Planctomycetaceae bacterium]
MPLACAHGGFEFNCNYGVLYREEFWSQSGQKLRQLALFLVRLPGIGKLSFMEISVPKFLTALGTKFAP